MRRVFAVLLVFLPALQGQQAANRPASAASEKTIAETDCTAAKLGSEIPVSAIGEPVSAVTLTAPQWRGETANSPAYCSIEGSMAPVDRSAAARPIRFGVALPASWKSRGAQLGGGGMNGMIPMLAGGVGRGRPSLLRQGIATYGSDSGHQMGGFGTPGRGRGMPAGVAAPNPAADEWALNDEAVANLGYMQLKKTHDAAMVRIERCVASARASTTSSAGRRAAASLLRSRSATLPITPASPPKSRSSTFRP